MNRLTIRTAILAVALAALTSCANLKEIREYAGQSAQLASYSELTNRWATTHEREAVYVIGEAAKASVAEDKERKAIQKDLLEIHSAVATYFEVLAKLAGDDAFTVTKDVDELAKSVKAAKFLGFEDKHVDAYANVVKIVSGWILSAYQQREIKRYIEEGNEPIRTLLEGMGIVAGAYRGTFVNEVGRARYLNLAATDSAQDRIVATLARIEFARISSEGAAAQKRAQSLRDAAQKIAQGHQDLYDKRNDLSGKEAIELVKKINKDLKAIRKSLDTAKE